MRTSPGQGSPISETGFGRRLKIEKQRWLYLMIISARSCACACSKPELGAGGPKNKPWLVPRISAEYSVHQSIATLVIIEGLYLSRCILCFSHHRARPGDA